MRGQILNPWPGLGLPCRGLPSRLPGRWVRPRILNPWPVVSRMVSCMVFRMVSRMVSLGPVGHDTFFGRMEVNARMVSRKVSRMAPIKLFRVFCSEGVIRFF